MTYYKLKIFLLIFIFSHLLACSANKSYKLSGNAFGTIYYIVIENDKTLDPNDIHSNIKYILNNIDNSASNYKNNSEIFALNEFKGGTFKSVSSNLFNIIQKAKMVGDQTNGYFDITLGDIKISKGFYLDKKSIKKDLKRNYTYKDIVLSGNNLIKKPYSHVNIDLSGIAKGYAVDLVFNYLISKNISNFLINIGGEIKTYSRTEDFITIAIDDPTNNQQYIEEVLLNNNSIATSGTYIDTVNFEGLEISHITNPKTLRNVSNLNILVSVIHEECAIADGLATGLIAMNPEKIINFSNSNGIASMLTIVRKGELEKSYSTEFLKYLSD